LPSDFGKKTQPPPLQPRNYHEMMQGFGSSSRKCQLLEEVRVHLRENANFSKKCASIFEKTRTSRRSARPSSRKCQLLEEVRVHLRENANFSKKCATIFEKTRTSRRSARPSSRKCHFLDNLQGGRGDAPIGSSVRRPISRFLCQLSARRAETGWCQQMPTATRRQPGNPV
jgi:hypothetical protein